MTRIVVFAEDPGGANALGPVLESLQSVPGVEVETWVSVDAAAVMPTGVAHKILPDGERPALPVEDPAVVVTGTSGYRSGERSLRRSAGARAVPTVAVVDYWNNYRERFDEEEANGRRALHIAVVDEHMAASLAAAGIRASVEVTGHPAHDRLLALRPTVTAVPVVPRVLFVSQPWRDITGGDPRHPLHPGYDEAEVLTATAAALGTVLAGRPGVLAVRRHPRERHATPALPLAEGLTFELDRHPTAVDALQAADLVVGMSAAVLVDSCVLGRPTISIQPNLRLEDALPTNAGGHSRALYDAGELGPVLEELIFDEAARSAQMEKARGFAVPGDATRRLTTMILRTARR